MTDSVLPAGITKPECILDLKATLGEGPVWIASENAVYFTDIIACRVYRFQISTKELTTWDAPAKVGFLLPVARGGFLAGLPDGLHRFNPSTGVFSHMCTVEPEEPDNRLNDGCVDGKGRIWFGTMNDVEETSPNGSIYRVVAQQDELVVSHWDEGYAVTNGPTLSPDGKTLYACSSAEKKIYAFDVDDAGSLSGKRVFATFSEGYPDGVVTDSEGNVWCGTWAGGQITRIRPDGTYLPPIPIPASNVTKVAFGGPDLRTVFVTTARRDLTEEQLLHEPQAGGLFVFQSDVPGLPQHLFQL